MVFFCRATLAAIIATHFTVALAHDDISSGAAGGHMSANGRNDPDDIGMLTTFVEETDAGQTIATAVILPASTTEVQGSVTAITDLYQFTASQSGFFAIFAAFTGDSIDATLLLFNSNGQGLAGDDDWAGNLNSLIIIELTAGANYYFAVGSFPGIAGYQTQADADNRVNQFLARFSGVLPGPTPEALGVVAPFGFSSLPSANYTVTIEVVIPTDLPTSSPIASPTKKPSAEPTVAPSGKPTPLNCPPCKGKEDDTNLVTVYGHGKILGICKEKCAAKDRIPDGFECGFCPK